MTLEIHRAACVIQNAWRRYINRAIFRFYMDLISFRQAADAHKILRAINPAEASLIDRASQMHIRFRLGGVTFPPTIYYKIFTHAPLVDVNAYAPRDYTKQRRADFKRSGMEQPNLGVTMSSLGSVGAASWYAYRRTENNPWRPVAEKLVQEDISNLPFHAAYSRSTSPTSGSRFLPTRTQRKEEATRQRKRKKVLWMMKMYRKGLACEKDDVSSDDAAVQMLKALDNDDIEELLETGKDLLDWSQNLDFDSYMQQWFTTATSFGDMNTPLESVEDDDVLSMADSQASSHKNMDFRMQIGSLHE
eukprot:ANDGO_06483.mRNA.1 variant